MSEVFISYARETEVFAKKVAEALRSTGFRVWYDDDLPAHRSFSEVIEERLHEARAVLVLWSAEAAKSQWVRAEANTARTAGTLIQVRVDRTKPPIPFSEIQCIDLSDWKGDTGAPGWKKIVASIEELVGQKSDLQFDSVTKPAARAEAIRSIPRWVWSIAGIAGLAVVGTGIALFTIRTPTVLTPAVATASIRVSVPPFDATGQSPDALKLADRLTSDIGDALSANQVAVAVQSAGTAKSRLLLSGLVRGDQNTLIVRVRLDDTSLGTTLWSKSFEGTPAAIDTLRVQVAGLTAYQVVTAASSNLNAIRDQPEAITSILELIDTASDDWGSARALSLARDLVKRMPQASLSHALLALRLLSYAKKNPLPQSQVPLINEARKEATVALALDQKGGLAYPVLAALTPFSAWSKRDALYLKAIEAAPVDARHIVSGRYCFSLIYSGRNQDALAEARSAVAVDPFSNGPRDCLAFALLATGQREQAAELMEEVRREWPDNVGLWADELLLTLYGEPVNTKLLQASLDSPLKSRVPQTYYELWQRIFRSLDASPAEKKSTAELVVTAVDHASFSLAEAMGALTRLGDVDDAFAVAERNFAANMYRPFHFDPTDSSFLFSPGGTALRKDHRFMPLAAQLGLVDYWRTSGRWPDFCSEPTLPYDCKVEAARLAHKAN